MGGGRANRENREEQTSNKDFPSLVLSSREDRRLTAEPQKIPLLLGEGAQVPAMSGKAEQNETLNVAEKATK